MWFIDSKPASGITPCHRLAQGLFGPERETNKDYGNFDIQIEKSIDRIEEIRKAFNTVLLPHVEIVEAGKSVAFGDRIPCSGDASRRKTGGRDHRRLSAVDQNGCTGSARR